MSLFGKKSDAERFETMVAAHERGVYLTCLGMLHNREDAQDCLQETMLRAYKAFSAFDNRAQVKTWLHKIAVNVCIDKIRRVKPAVSLDSLREDGFDMGDSAQDTYLKMEEGERRRLLKSALNALPDDMRALITLREINGLSYDDIASVLDIPLGTVKSRVSRAREKLARLLLQNAELFDRDSV